MKFLLSLIVLALPVSCLFADEPKPFGTGMNGEPPLVQKVDYWQQAVTLYPEAADSGSAIYREIIKINAWLEQTKDPVCNAPDRKLRVAHMAAAKLGMPMKSGPQPAPQPVETVQVNPPELMLMIQQEQATAGGTRISSRDNKAGAVYTEGRWKGKLKKELVGWCCQQFAAKYGYTPLYEEGAPVGGWQTEESRRAAAASKAARDAELLRRADEERRHQEEMLRLEQIRREKAKKNGGL